MDERDKRCIGYTDGQYVVIDNGGSVVAMLAPGAVCEIWMGNHWQAVKVESGGYRGCYYETPQGVRGRLALGMGVRLWQVCAEGCTETRRLSVEQARLIWIGKQARSKVPLAAGLVCGVVLDVTRRGMVLFGYTSPMGGVPVRVTFPVERIDDVLAVVSSD